MKKYYTSPDEFVGFTELVDVINHNSGAFERHAAKSKKKFAACRFRDIVIFGCLAMVYRYHEKKITDLEKKVKELEEKGD